MIYKVEVSQQADNDLRDIFEYIAFELQKMCEKPTSLDVGDSADIDVYKGSPIAQTGDIDINLDIINSIVNEGKSLDDVLDRSGLLLYVLYRFKQLLHQIAALMSAAVCFLRKLRNGCGNLCRGICLFVNGADKSGDLVHLLSFLDRGL